MAALRLCHRIVACRRLHHDHYRCADGLPGASWAAIPESELGSACRRELDATRSYLRTLDTTALMAVQDGRVLFSEGSVRTASIVFSVRKSVLSMMYGKYVANGTIDLDRTLADLGIDDVGGLPAFSRKR